MKTGLELLKSKIYTGNRTAGFEQVLGINLPELFKFYCEMYELGQECFQNAKRSFDDILLPITSVEYVDQNLNIHLRISHFYDLQELQSRWKEDIQFSDWYKTRSLLPIAYEEVNLGQIFISLSQNDIGRIWYIGAYENDKPIYLTSNIFEFVSKLFETEINDEDFKNKQVYKNWGEDFWRVRKE